MLEINMYNNSVKNFGEKKKKKMEKEKGWKS